MTKQDVVKLVAMYIVAIGPKGCPNSHVWMAVDPQMSDIDRHMRVLGFLKEADLCRESGYFVTLTDKGQRMLKQIVATMAPKL